MAAFPRRPAAILDAIADGLAAASVSALTLSVLIGVISRGVGEPLIWTDEVSRFLMIWSAALGWIQASRRRAHIRIRFFLDRLPPRGGAFVEIAMQLAVALLGVALIAYGAELVERNLDIEATTVPISMSWTYLPLILAGAVCVAQALAEGLDAARALRASA